MTMYDPIFARSFSPTEQKKFGHCAFLGCMVIALSICTVFKPHLYSFLSISNLQLTTHAGLEDMLIVKDTNISQPFANLQASTDDADLEDMIVVKDTNISQPFANLQASTDDAGLEDMTIVKDTNISQPFANLQMSTDDVGLENMLKVNDTNISQPLEIGTKEIKSMCRVLEPRSDYCEIKGSITIHGNSSTIFIASSQMPINSAQNISWIIRPYARKGNGGAMENVREWTVKLEENRKNIPSCTQNHTTPAILFSTGGYSGNHFHDFSDIVIPLYSTSKNFNGEVHFLTTDSKPWWIGKFNAILRKLSRHEMIDIDRKEGTHCYQSLIVGLKCHTHKELGIDTATSQGGASMKDFRQFLRTTYSLKRSTAVKIREASELQKPRLMIISRKGSRILTNEGKTTKMAQKLGYDVVLADASLSTNLSKFAEVVNSCDVLMGVHGAGLTNMVFLPDNAVVIQIIPFGGIDGFAKQDFGEPAEDMNIRYLEYKIRVTESSLINQYPLDHAVIRDPFSFHKQGWVAMRSIYLDKQNVSLDVTRFRGTLLKALKLLQH